MKITIESTSKIVQLNGVPARLWEGETESGIKVHCFITRVGVDKDDPRIGEFEKDLEEHSVPSPAIQSYPARLII